MQTYSVNKQVPDSASSATAMLAGVKCQHRTLGVNQDVTYQNCSSVKGNEVQSVLSHAHQEGRCSLLSSQEIQPDLCCYPSTHTSGKA